MLSAAILDDEIWAVKDMERLLNERKDIQLVYKSTNPRNTLHYLKENHVDVLFTDIKMPDMTGLELAKELSKLEKVPYIVIVSGYGDFEYMREAIVTAVFDYLLKPIMREDLEKVLLRILQVEQDTQENVPEKEADSTGEEKNEIFAQVLLYIQANYHKDITLADVAKQNYVSERYITKLFSKYFDLSFGQYLTKLRLEGARDLLLRTGKSVDEVARDVGYSNGSYFSKAFKKYYNMTPNSLRRDGRNE